jgi:aspartate aminotransferase
MAKELTSKRITAVRDAKRGFWNFLTHAESAKRRNEPGALDFSLGNPHEMPPAGYVETLKKWTEPRHPQWFNYATNDPGARAAVAAALRDWRGLPFEAADIAMTTGAFGAIAAALHALVDPGEEVIFSLPPWFNYESMIVAVGGVPVKVRVDAASFDLDLGAIASAITPRTRMVIVNTPHNPTGKIYPPETLQGLADLLTRASAEHGRAIYLLSDEPYSRLVFEGKPLHSPTAYYPNTLLAYSYGKTLLTPGERIGYLALAPSMPEREVMRESLTLAQIVCGFAFPNAILQYAVGDLEKLSIDVAHLQRKRDRLLEGLRAAGYDVHTPDGTFFLLPKSPIADDVRFCEILAEDHVFVLPGSVCEMPGYFRITFTATEEMVERALPRFAAAIARATNRPDRARAG